MKQLSSSQANLGFEIVTGTQGVISTWSRGSAVELNWLLYPLDLEKGVNESF
jgi:hypothetical protein